MDIGMLTGMLTTAKVAIMILSMILILSLVQMFVPENTAREIDIHELDKRVTELETTQRCRVNYDRMHKI